jgi:hypothetical protein
MRAIGIGFALLATLAVAATGGTRARPLDAQRDANVDQTQPVLWTAIIPEAFPRNIYTWRLWPDGHYDEDGHDRASGLPAQQTLTGRWTVDGARMVLRQDGNTFLFDGLIAGVRYAGTLYLQIRRASHFCALKGEAAPDNCAPPGVAAAQRGISTQ